jgi:hypothetical protein
MTPPIKVFIKVFAGNQRMFSGRIAKIPLKNGSFAKKVWIGVA